MASIDPFGKTDKLDDAMLATLVTRFEARGKNAQFSKMLGDYLDAMSIAPTARVLDMGCGTGLAARAIARGADFAGAVTGIDLSPYLVEAAKRLAHEEGLAEHLEFRPGDVRRLDFADATFDALVAHTLFSHVEDPLSVLKEAARVVKPGGMIGIFDGDYASLTFDQADSVKGKANDEALISALVTNPRVMRHASIASGRRFGASYVLRICLIRNRQGKLLGIGHRGLSKASREGGRDDRERGKYLGREPAQRFGRWRILR